MPKTFVTSDTHFGHKKIIEFEREHRPFATIEEHDMALVDAWNSVVGKDDKATGCCLMYQFIRTSSIGSRAMCMDICTLRSLTILVMSASLLNRLD